MVLLGTVQKLTNRRSHRLFILHNSKNLKGTCTKLLSLFTRLTVCVLVSKRNRFYKILILNPSHMTVCVRVSKRNRFNKNPIRNPSHRTLHVNLDDLFFVRLSRC